MPNIRLNLSLRAQVAANAQVWGVEVRRIRRFEVKILGIPPELLCVVRTVKVDLGTFACNGIETYLDADIAAGVRAALDDFTQRLESGRPPLSVPDALWDADVAEPAMAVNLPLDERSWHLLWREALRQGTTVDQLASHSVLVYLAELDRLTPPNGATA